MGYVTEEISVNGAGPYDVNLLPDLGLFIVFIWKTSKNAKSDINPQEETSAEQPIKLGKAILLIVVGLIGLIVGGELIVKSAVQIAVNLGVSDAIDRKSVV